MDIKHKLEQINASLEYQSNEVKNLVKSICEGIEVKIKKNDFSYNFGVNKENKVYGEIKKVIGIFRNFDITVNIFKDFPTQTIYCVYFNKE